MHHKNRIKLPSNKKFGVVFTSFLILIILYLYFHNYIRATIILLPLLIVLIFITIFLPSFLTPFNQLWMRLGLILNVFISPLVLGFIFYILITPISVISKIFGRDELQIRRKSSKSFWITVDERSSKIDFTKQF